MFDIYTVLGSEQFSCSSLEELKVGFSIEVHQIPLFSVAGVVFYFCFASCSRGTERRRQVPRVMIGQHCI